MAISPLFIPASVFLGVLKGAGPLPAFKEQGVPSETEAEGQTEELEIGVEILGGSGYIELRKNDQGQDKAQDKGCCRGIKIALIEALNPVSPKLPKPRQQRPGKDSEKDGQKLND